MLNATILKLWEQPYHRGLPTNLEEQGAILGQEGFPGEGPFMQIALLWPGELCSDAWFETYPCPSAIACGSWLCSWLKGKTRKQVVAFTAADLSSVLGGLPQGKEHCATLTIQALHSALSQVPEEWALLPQIQIDVPSP